jgi:hypothetical protein
MLDVPSRSGCKAKLLPARPSRVAVSVHRAARCLLCLIATLVSGAVSAAPSPSLEDRYLEFFEAYQPLSSCVAGKREALNLSPEEWARSVAKQTDFDDFAADAISILSRVGFDHVARAVRQHESDSVRYAQGLMAALGGMSVAAKRSQDRETGLLVFQGLALAMIRVGRHPQVRCEPSKELISLMQQVENDYLQHPRPRNPR